MILSIQNKALKIFLIICIVLLILVILAGIVLCGISYSKDKDLKDVRIMGYYIGDLTNDELDKIKLNEYTNILYGFAYANETTGFPDLSEAKKSGLVNFLAYKQKHNLDLKFQLCIGSFDTEKLLDESYRKEYASKCKELVDTYNLDGIDIDWEYPQNDAEYYAFGQLLYEIRQAIGNSKLLSFAATTTLYQVDEYDNKLIQSVVDYVNVMTYDFSLEKQSNVITTKIILLNYFVTKGYKKSMLNIGVPFYGRSASKEYEYYGYNSLMDMVDNGELTLVEKSDYSYAYGQYGQVSFDTAKITKKKAKFVKRCNFGGIFTWHISCDRNNELLDAMLYAK